MNGQAWNSRAESRAFVDGGNCHGKRAQAPSRLELEAYNVTVITCLALFSPV